MTARNVLVLPVLALLVASSAAFGQEDDDLLAPLTPAEKATGKRKKRTKPEDANKTAIQIELPTPTSGAQLFIDGAEAGEVIQNEAARPMSPGTHKVQVKRPGFKDFNGTVTVRPGAVAHVLVVLEPVAGVVAVQSEPAGAEVLVDGARAGVTPMRGTLVAPGTHEVTIRREGYAPSVQKISVSAGKDYELHAQLRPGSDRPERDRLSPTTVADRSPMQAPSQAEVASGPLYTQWYFWAGVGVAAAATTAAIIVTSPMGQKRICGGRLCDAVINSPFGVRF